MNLLLIAIAGVIGYGVGFVAGILQVNGIRKTEAVAHNRLIERKNAEIWRLQNSNNDLQKTNNELRQRNNAQVAAFDRMTGNDRDYFKKF